MSERLLKRDIKETMADFFKTQPVLRVWLFGSFARGEQHDDSDIDLLVTLDPSQSVGLRFFGMWGELERLLGRSVDIVVEGDLEPYALDSFNRDKTLIYERAA